MMLEKIKDTHPLIHSITSPIAINDCANAVLAVGAQPIMAEHPGEVAGITRLAKALTLSTANITDVRMESMMISAREAFLSGIPSLIDVVGVTCSPLRMNYVKRLVEECHPTVIKGNYSEIRALAGVSFDASSGIDVSDEDKAAGWRAMAGICQGLARKTGAVVLASGAEDLVCDCERVTVIRNGHPMMARVTGTGCILTCITGAFLSVGEPYDAVVEATVCMGICGELAFARQEKQAGLGSFHVALMDEFSLLTDEVVEKLRRDERVCL